MNTKKERKYLDVWKKGLTFVIDMQNSSTQRHNGGGTQRHNGSGTMMGQGTSKSVTGLALLLSLLSAVVYGYCCFLGLNFWLGGKVIVSLFITLVALAVLWYAMHMMIHSKQVRNARDGRQSEWKSGVVVLLVIVAGCPFFGKFMEVNDYAHDGTLNQGLYRIINTARTIDNNYKEYAEQRIKDVPRRYRKSLRRRLMPEHFDSIANERRKWLTQQSKPSIWNIYSATNIRQLMSATGKWTTEYQAISSVIYEDENDEVEPFSHSPSNSNINELEHLMYDLHMPDWRSLAAIIICFCGIMTRYWVTRRVKTG